MIGKKKIFSKTLFSQNDPKSREIIKTFLKKQNIFVFDNPNKYDVDLISQDKTLKIEIERRLVWIDSEFPYSEINVPERKAKFFKDGTVHYIILSRDYSSIGVILGEIIKPFINDENLVMNPNKYVKSDEYFYKIPKEKFIWIKL